MKKYIQILSFLLLIAGTVHGKSLYNEKHIFNNCYDNGDKSIVVIDKVHERGHAGQLYYAGNYTASLADSSTFYIIIDTSTASNEIHMTFSINAGGDATIELYESPIYTGGSAITAYNVNRISTNTATISLIDNTAIVSNPGTKIGPTIFIPGGTFINPQSSTSGGALEARTEHILSQTKETMIIITNISGGEDDFGIVLSWYEK